ncbi:zinc finger BED domain-containing protein RICESLEEPER 2-like [Rhizophagus irregularis DAOM 181602=DAOM 197198]|nr:zinc finger BED domain-containing protein RICESLEEPER 2-like [Rhizophagus irregularis DAOM 181602=DAOM 197198]
MSVDLTEPTTPPAQRLGKKKALRSELFTKDLFEERSLPQDHEKAKTHREVQCLNCLNNKVWYRKIGDANTTNLWRHVEVHHPEKDPRPNKKAKKLIAEGQNTLDEFVGQTEVPSKFTQTDFRKFLSKWIIADDQPFTTVENIHFRNVVKVLNSDALVPKADTIKNDINESFDEERKKRKILLQKIPGRISFALDAWTSINGYGFLAITAHWITKNWKLCDSLLDFIKLSGPHSGENICNAFVKSCDDFGILEKIFAITSNNATNNDTFMKYLENTCQKKNISFDAINNHCHCIAHIMNLAVQEILKQIKAGEAEPEDAILEMPINTGEVIPKLRKLIVKIRASPQRQEKFACHAEAAGLKELQLILDVKTRWNSTHNLLERALKMREALDAIARSDKELQNFELSDDEWNRIDEVVSVLMIFIHTTNVMSSAKYPMLSSVVPLYNYLIDELEDYCESHDSSSDIVIATKAGIEKLERYYAKTDDTNMYTVATVLDPRLKLSYYEDHKWKQNFINFAKETVLDIYNTEYGPSEHLEGGNVNVDNNAEPQPDILLWWKANETVYPHLAKMARDYIAITATSVSVERVFSGGADLLATKRCSLKVKTIRACMCLKLWQK